MKPKMTVYQMGGKMPIVPDPKKKLSPADQKFNAAARSREAENLTEMRNALKEEGPEALAKFDKELKAKGFKVVKKPVKKMMGGGKMDMTYAKGGKVENKIKRLEKREASLVSRGSKAVDEGRDRKADRLLGRAARIQNRVINITEPLPAKKMMDGGKMPKYEKGGMMKYLKGGQVKLDKNKDGKITGADFKMMAKKK